MKFAISFAVAFVLCLTIFYSVETYMAWKLKLPYKYDHKNNIFWAFLCGLLAAAPL